MIIEMIVSLTGENDYLRLAEQKKLVRDFEQKNGDFGIEQLSAEGVDFGKLLDMVSSLPFLASRRMIILNNPSKNKVLTEEIEKLIEAVAETTDLIFVEQKFDKRSTLYKNLKKLSDMREFGKVDENSLSSWLVGEAKNRGAQLGLPDARYLVQRVGLNQMIASNELDKLINFDTQITRKSIDTLTEAEPSSTIFELIDAAFGGSKKRAIEIYEDQRKQQKEPQLIMGMMAWQVHALALSKFNQTESIDEIARQAKMSPYVVGKTMNLAQRMTQDEVRKLVEDTLRLDTRMKSERIEADDAFRHFLLSL